MYPPTDARKIITQQWYTLVINHIILTDYSRQVVPKPNSSAKYTEIFFKKCWFSDTITNGLNNGMSPENCIVLNLSYCVNLMSVTQLLISTFRGIDETQRLRCALSTENDIFLWAQLTSSFLELLLWRQDQANFLFSLINPSRRGPKGPLRNKVLFPTREKKIIAVLLIMLKAVAYKHVFPSGFCTGLKGFWNSE